MLAWSPPLLAELDATLHRKFTVTPPVRAFLTAYRHNLTLVEPTTLATSAFRDSDDDVVLATAVQRARPRW